MSFKENNMIDIRIDDSDFDEENVGAISVWSNSDERIGICILLIKGADPELWMGICKTEKIIAVLEKSMVNSI